VRLLALLKQTKEQKALNSLTVGWQSVPSRSWTPRSALRIRQSLTAEDVSELGVSNLSTDLFIFCYEVF